MEKHPIESLMGVSMDNIKDMVDVNTVIGDPVQTQDGSTIIPISRVAFGFVAGGGEYAVSGAQTGAYGMPFAGGAGAGDFCGSSRAARSAATSGTWCSA